MYCVVGFRAETAGWSMASMRRGGDGEEGTAGVWVMGARLVTCCAFFHATDGMGRREEAGWLGLTRANNKERRVWVQGG